MIMLKLNGPETACAQPVQNILRQRINTSSIMVGNAPSIMPRGRPAVTLD
jgi:hypothetical protein